MKRIAALSAAGLVALGALPAVAGGLASPAVEPAPTAPVAYATTAPDGDWTGFSAGLTLGNNWAKTDPDIGDGNDVYYGIRGTYDYDFGQFVLGGVASYDWSDTGIGGGDKLNGIGHLGVRGGYDLGQTLLYAQGGAAFVDARIAGNSDTDTGYFLGIGAEHKLRGNMTIGAELNYNKVDDFGNTGVDFKDTQLGVNVGFRF